MHHSKKRFVVLIEMYQLQQEKKNIDEKAEVAIKQGWGSRKESELRTVCKVYSRGVQAY